jgi:DNA-directed RNA polymerase subunit RPC12/RpoP
MKFLCVDCDEQMTFEEKQEPGDGTFGASFSCPKCGHKVAMLANPMETQLVGSLGVQIGGRTLDEQPMELTRRSMIGREDAFQDVAPDAPGGVRWSAEGEERLTKVPKFVRGMVKKVYVEWAAEHGISEITPAVMDEARADLGLEGM